MTVDDSSSNEKENQNGIKVSGRQGKGKQGLLD